MLTCELSGISGEHFVDEGALIDFYRLVVAAVPLGDMM
jgi:hypothetical protein